MIKIFGGGGRGGDTFKTPSHYEQLLPLPNPYFKKFFGYNDRTPESWLFKYLMHWAPCAFSSALISTELEVSIETKQGKMFLKRLQLFF